jgi:hypothetical protein
MSSNKLYYVPSIYSNVKYKIFDIFKYNEKDLCFKYKNDKDNENKYKIKYMKWTDDKYLTTIEWIENNVVVNKYQRIETIKEINFELVEKYNKVLKDGIPVCR